MVGVGESLDDQERCAFTVGAFVFHEFFDEAEVVDLLFVEFPNSPLMGAGITAKTAVAGAIGLVVAAELLYFAVAALRTMPAIAPYQMTRSK